MHNTEKSVYFNIKEKKELKRKDILQLEANKEIFKNELVMKNMFVFRNLIDVNEDIDRNGKFILVGKSDYVILEKKEYDKMVNQISKMYE
jgi:hypothetical protein